MQHAVHWRWKNERAFRNMLIGDRGIYGGELEARITELYRLNQKGRKEGGESRVQLHRETGELIEKTEFVARYSRVIAVRMPAGHQHKPTPPVAAYQPAAAPPTHAPEVEHFDPVPRTHWLHCPLCRESMVDAVYSSCCRTTFCAECIAQELGEDRECPVCRHAVEALTPNLRVRSEINRK